MSLTMPEIAKSLMEAELILGDWDMPPELISVAEMPDGSAEILRWPVPDAFWGMGPVFKVLHALTVVVEHRGAPFDLDPGTKAVALVLVTEGWGLVDPTPDDLAWAEQNSIQDHPKGRECKMVCLVDLASQEVHYVNAWRDGETAVADTAPDGRVPSALLGLAKVCV